MAFQLVINGRRTDVDAEPLDSLAHVLRDVVGLTGTKICCYEGYCGACTVIVDGRPTISCLYPVVNAAERDIRTVEGLAGAGCLSVLQDALLEAGGVQCGICTPGMLMMLTALLERDPTPSKESVQEALTGNLCRCTGYHKIIEAVLAAAPAYAGGW